MLSPNLEQCRSYLTELLRLSTGTMVLNDHQVHALYNFTQAQGLFFEGRVGCGKTLVSMLLPVLLRYVRPDEQHRVMLCVPDPRTTRREFVQYQQHWQSDPSLMITSHASMSLRKNVDLLVRYNPTLIIVDECQVLSNIDGSPASTFAVRVDEFLRGVGQPTSPRCSVAVMTGTGSKNSLLDYSHQIVWALRTGCPFPRPRADQRVLASVVDPDGTEESLPALKRGMPEAFGGCVTSQDARDAFGALLHATPGIYISTDSYDEVKLVCRPMWAATDDVIEADLAKLREYYELPDGWMLCDGDTNDRNALGIYQAARALQLGFFPALDPRPPKSFLTARRAWARYVLEQRELNPSWTEAQVRDAAVLAEGSAEHRLWARWQFEDAAFPQNRVVEWRSDAVIRQVIEWAGEQPAGSVVWSKHVDFARRLSQVTGWEYYGRKGRSRAGRQFEDDLATQPVIASIDANGTGRNLQQFDRGLIIGVASSWRDWEQLLARFHRQNQKSACVHFDYLVGSVEDTRSVDRAFESTAAATMKNQQPKLLSADFERPGTPPDTAGFRRPKRNTNTVANLPDWV